MTASAECLAVHPRHLAVALQSGHICCIGRIGFAEAPSFSGNMSISQSIAARIAALLYGNAVVRSLGLIVQGVVGGVLTSWLISDLNPTCTGVEWRLVVQTHASWCLTAFVLVFAVYSYGLHRYEVGDLTRDERRRLLDEAIRAVMPTILDRAKEDAAAGKIKSIGELARRVLGR